MEVQGMLSTDVTHLSRMSNGKMGGYKIESHLNGKIKFSVAPINMEFESATAPFLVLEGSASEIANVLELMSQAIRDAVSQEQAQNLENAGRHL